MMNINFSSTKPVFLVDLNRNDFELFLDSFDHVFSDCDGVIWTQNALPRVGEFFDLMKKHGKSVHFASNNSLRSRENYEQMFKEANIEDGYEHLITPSVAIAEYLHEQGFDQKIYSVSCPETTKKLESYGFICKTGPDLAVDYYEDYINYLEDDLEIGAVVFDSDFKANLAKIHKAITYLKRPEVLFLCGATDRQIYFKQGYSALGCAVFTDIVALEANRVPVILGKPSRDFGECAMKRAGVIDPRRVLFIGDMLEQDVGLGASTGFQTLLILTNVTEEDMMASMTKPHYFAESLASIVPLLKK